MEIKQRGILGLMQRAIRGSRVRGNQSSFYKKPCLRHICEPCVVQIGGLFIFSRTLRKS